ncbi:MAG: hypothetical protein NC347_07120 [Clostridium sp.]|nr:hypothetical protein [Clostridium sp.]
MNDLQMTRDGDLAILNHDIATTDSIEQGIYIRLRWWYGEWKFGPDYGMKYFENVFVKNPNKTLIMSDVSAQIMSVDGVKSVDKISVDIDYKTRKAVIKYSVTTESKERFEREVSIWSNME